MLNAHLMVKTSLICIFMCFFIFLWLLYFPINKTFFLEEKNHETTPPPYSGCIFDVFFENWCWYALCPVNWLCPHPPLVVAYFLISKQRDPFINIEAAWPVYQYRSSVTYLSISMQHGLFINIETALPIYRYQSSMAYLSILKQCDLTFETSLILGVFSMT